MRTEEIREAWRAIFRDGDNANAAEEALVEAMKRPLAEQLALQELGARVLQILDQARLREMAGFGSQAALAAEDIVLYARSLGLLGEKL